VSASVQGRGVGLALKLRQRAWGLDHGVRSIGWTFDPLVRRNAHFNLAKLGARPVEYLTDFYGPMTDGINGEDASDRLLVSWRLDRPLPAPGSTPAYDGRQVLVHVPDDGVPLVTESDAPLVAVPTPADVEALRRTSPVAASAWRLAVRSTLAAELAAGSTVAGLDRAGNYLVAREDRR
jgi:predicted GNAT superfamily acetyltransferase